jgi:hypothetical protein
VITATAQWPQRVAASFAISKIRSASAAKSKSCRFRIAKGPIMPTPDFAHHPEVSAFFRQLRQEIDEALRTSARASS